MGKSDKSKKRREVRNLEDALRVHGPLAPPTPVEPAVPSANNPAPRPLPLSLADIRTETLRAHTNTAHTIADLEAWRAEIEATIAFLKARQ